jgi:DNA-binding NarL/FixJ family response regulator
MAQSIRILVVEDHQVAREGMAFLLGSREGLEVVGEAENGAVAVQMAGEVLPDVIIMDYDMPKMNGLDATRVIRSRFPEIRIIAHSWHDSERNAQGMLDAGASAFIGKGSAIPELIAAIRAVGSNRDDEELADAPA